MGLFRTLNAKNHTVDEALANEDEYKMKIIYSANRLKSASGKEFGKTCDEFETCLYKWAEWRELRARLEDDNDSDVI